MSNDIQQANTTKRSPIFKRPTDEDCGVEVGDILDLLAALMRKNNRGNAEVPGTDLDDGELKPADGSQN